MQLDTRLSPAPGEPSEVTKPQRGKTNGKPSVRIPLRMIQGTGGTLKENKYPVKSSVKSWVKTARIKKINSNKGMRTFFAYRSLSRELYLYRRALSWCPEKITV
jgi:hypothetical protein